MLFFLLESLSLILNLSLVGVTCDTCLGIDLAYILHFPVNLWVVFLELGKFEDEVLLAKVGDREVGLLGVTI